MLSSKADDKGNKVIECFRMAGRLQSLVTEMNSLADDLTALHADGALNGFKRKLLVIKLKP